MNLFVFFWTILKAALFSTGGMGSLPSIHNDFIAFGWATEKVFTEAISIGQLTPGPNGLWVISLSYLVADLPGAILAAAAIAIPPMLIVAVKMIYTKIADRPATQGLLDGLLLSVVGISIVLFSTIFKNNGINITTVIIAAASFGLAISRKVPTLVILAAAALVGVIFR